jgi:hypothetical protein
VSREQRDVEKTRDVRTVSSVSKAREMGDVGLGVCELESKIPWSGFKMMALFVSVYLINKAIVCTSPDKIPGKRFYPLPLFCITSYTEKGLFMKSQKGISCLKSDCRKAYSGNPKKGFPADPDSTERAPSLLARPPIPAVEMHLSKVERDIQEIPISDFLIYFTPKRISSQYTVNSIQHIACTAHSILHIL